MKLSHVDPYCFPGTTVLRNIQGLMDKVALEQFESMSAALAADTLYRNPPHKTDLPYLKSIHRALFGNVYPGAGETRRDLGRMVKTRENGSVVLYGDSAFVDTELARMFSLLAAEDYLKGLPIDRFALRAAYFYGELDAIHPFREGNSRTLRCFFHSVAWNAGYRIDWGTYSAPESARAPSTSPATSRLCMATLPSLRPCSPPSFLPSEPGLAVHFTLHP